MSTPKILDRFWILSAKIEGTKKKLFDFLFKLTQLSTRKTGKKASAIASAVVTKIHPLKPNSSSIRIESTVIVFLLPVVIRRILFLTNVENRRTTKVRSGPGGKGFLLLAVSS